MSTSDSRGEQAVQPVTSLAPSYGDDPHTPELYRQVYISLELPPRTQGAVIGITSALSGEGRTSAALALAETLAADLDEPVSLVEVDLDRPSLAPYFGIAAAPGLSEVLRDEYRLDEVLRPVSRKLSVVPAGITHMDSARLLRQLPLSDPFHGPHAPAGVVVLDLPPIINHSYSPLAASVADAVVLVVRANVTPTEVIREAIARLGDRPPQGVIFNGPRSSLPSWWPGRGVSAPP